MLSTQVILGNVTENNPLGTAQVHAPQPFWEPPDRRGARIIFSPALPTKLTQPGSHEVFQFLVRSATRGASWGHNTARAATPP